MNNTIYSINGPVVTVKDTCDFSMTEMVYVGSEHLVGEVIGVNEDRTTIQVYEETSGLRPGEPVTGTGAPISVTLGPGILSNIYDGIERPLKDIALKSGAFIARGSDIPALDQARRFDVTICVKPGDVVSGGTIYATCPETPVIIHKCMVPPNISGTITEVAPSGSYTVNDPIAKLKAEDGTEHTLTLCHKWPIRSARPAKLRKPISIPLITGQRVIDTLFPIAKGGAAAVPGGFGTGKTMTQHQLAKWCDADIIVYDG